MKIFDRQGVLYNVNDFDKMVETTDNAFLLDVLATTHSIHKVNKMILDKHPDSSITGEGFSSPHTVDAYPTEDIENSIEKLKQVLLAHYSQEEIDEVLKDSDDNLKVTYVEVE